MILPAANLTLLIGRSLPVPAPTWLMDSFESAQFDVTDKGVSGFEMQFEAGRDGGLVGALDYPHLMRSTLRPFSRVIIIATLRAIPRVVFDGVLTNIQSQSSSRPGGVRIKVTGEDLSFFMDRTEEAKTHPASPDIAIVAKILARYAFLGLRPQVIPPPNFSPPPVSRKPTQKETDLKYLRTLAEKHNSVFFIKPGPLPLTGTAYWGPPPRLGVPQPALTQNMGPMTNVKSLSFQNKAEQPAVVSGVIQDSDFNVPLPVFTFFPTNIPLAPVPSLLTALPYVQRKKVSESNGDRYSDAISKAQAQTNRSTEDVITATGELDVTTYGRILEPRKLVGVRGVGFTFDGLYYVKQVSHKITRGAYMQSFTLTRDGTGSLLPFLPV